MLEQGRILFHRRPEFTTSCSVSPFDDSYLRISERNCSFSFVSNYLRELLIPVYSLFTHICAYCGKIRFRKTFFWIGATKRLTIYYYSDQENISSAKASMIAHLVCSRNFQAFRESSDSGEWPREMENGERTEEEERKWKRGGKGLFSPNPHPPPAVFSCSLFFNLSPPHHLKTWNRLNEPLCLPLQKIYFLDHSSNELSPA